MILRREMTRRPSGIFVPKQTIVMNSPTVKLGGHFTMWAHSSRGTRLVADFDNLVLNQGLDGIGTGAGVAAFCHVGSGTTTPAFTQTSLTTLVATSNNITSDINTYNAGGVYMENVRTYRFATGLAAGTLAEIGTASGAGASTLRTRALILDSGGSPTTITILSDEVLDVDYRFRLYIPAGDTTGTLTLSGTPYTWTMRAAQASSAAAWDTAVLLDGGIANGNNPTSSGVYGPGAVLGAITDYPTGGTGASMLDSNSPATYTPGDYYRIVNRSLALTSGNVAGGIKAMQCGFNTTQWQTLFATVIPKDATKVMTFSQRVTWARH